MLDILSTILIASASQQMDPYLVAAVVKVESKFDARTIGSVGEIGLMQLRPEYFAIKDKNILFDPKTNITIGISYLKEVQKRCKHKKDNTFLVCYNAGIRGGSRIENPKAFAYYKRVGAAMQELKANHAFAQAENEILNARLPRFILPVINFKLLSYNLNIGKRTVNKEPKADEYLITIIAASSRRKRFLSHLRNFDLKFPWVV